MLRTRLGRVDTVLAALDRHRPDVAAHSRRVATYAVRLASQYGLDRDTIETVRVGALLHDVGKLLVPARILEKPRRPNAREWEQLRVHPVLGMEIAHRAGFDDEVGTMILYHHERFDGTGYPDGLKRTVIPFTARLVGVMDAFDALTSQRDYRDRLSVAAARQMIAADAGTKFCPWIVSGLLALPPEMMTPPPGLEAIDRGQPGFDDVTPPERLADPWVLSLAASAVSLS
ncbi:MAG: HD domain-containing phosphohydrolase [Acidobacteriota bacterium]